MNKEARRKVLSGKPYPLGANWDGTGTNFALYSENATGVELCLFDRPDAGEVERIELREATGYVWHCLLPGIQPGQLYGYRVHGTYDPEHGLRFNPYKVLLDPYARAIAGKTDYGAPIFGYTPGSKNEDLAMNKDDDARGVPKSVVVNPYFEWELDRPPGIQLHHSVIYEVHVKGFTMLRPDIPEDLRGTYSGLASRAMIDYLTDLGVTAVELMPIHEFFDNKTLIDRGLKNYWGYNTIGFFAPTVRYSSTGDAGGHVAEFKAMVKTLHLAGIEVILDVVYNHTAEGNHLGPTLSFKGIDNLTYYRLVQGQERYYMDYTGTGNSLNMRSPQVLQMVMDSLRYWIVEMHVDGFRFDLASALARELHEVDRLSAFFDIIHQDPVISQVKLIAEPWDVGDGGYQVGNFPVLWSEWNGKYRDTVRKFWKGDDSQVAELAYRLTGSSDLYEASGRRPFASVNFVTSHDGFTLKDLASYNEKHNEANGENNQDGTNDNLSWNCGAEGPTDNPDIIALREKQMRNFMAILLLSQGVPMILGGDEIARSQGGNNNAYCQDNEISWFNWDIDVRRRAMLDFTKRVIQVRRRHPSLRRRKFFVGRRIRGAEIKDITWLRGDGKEMSDQEWESGWVHTLGMLLNGRIASDTNAEGDPIVDDTFLLLSNAHYESVGFVMPHTPTGEQWEVLLDTSVADLPDKPVHRSGDTSIEIAPRSLVLLRSRTIPQDDSPARADKSF